MAVKYLNIVSKVLIKVLLAKLLSESAMMTGSEVAAFDVVEIFLEVHRCYCSYSFLSPYSAFIRQFLHNKMDFANFETFEYNVILALRNRQGHSG